MKSLITALILTCLLTAGYSQGKPSIIVPSPSSQQILRMNFGAEEISIKYSRLKLRGRKFFGEGTDYLYPYGKTWRTGANAGTMISFSRDVFIHDKILQKGTYVLISWPGKKEWSISFYKDLKIGGQVDQFDPKNEALRVTVPVRQTEKPIETMTLAIKQQGSNSGNIVFGMEYSVWDIPFRLSGGSNTAQAAVSVTQPIGIDTVDLNYTLPPNRVELSGPVEIASIRLGEEMEFAGEPVPAGVYKIKMDAGNNKVSLHSTTGSQYIVSPLKSAIDKQFNYQSNGLAINFTHLPENNKSAYLRIDLENSSYTIPVTCDFLNKTLLAIDRASVAPDFKQQFTAAFFYLENNINLPKALLWFEEAIEQNPAAFWIYYQKARTLYQLGRYKESILSANKATQLSRDAKNEDYARLAQELLAMAEIRLTDPKGVIITNTGSKTDPRPQVVTAPASQENIASFNNRLALVIGVKTYKNISALRNPLNDAEDMSANLKKLGFTVIELFDPSTKRQIQDAIRKYQSILKQHKDAVGLIFYSGHGMQVDGANYLIPGGAEMQIKADVEDQCVNMDYIMTAIEEAKNALNIFILDACRNNPFSGFDRSGERGLSVITAPVGSYIVYATKPGSVASDGEGRNGLFTNYLLKHMLTPNLNIEQLFKKVARDVGTVSNNMQRPWISSDFTGDFYFLR
jgi:tetratricopeptide (TPR) repeat protein